MRAWREANPEHAKEVQRRSWHKHREKRLAEMRERASAPWWRAWREAYKPRMRELRMGYYRKDPEKYKRATAEWRILNRERAREYCRKYRIQNPETVQINGQVRRARKFNATRGKPSAIRAFIKEMRTTKRLRCYWCGVSTKKGERHVDHIIPLSRGGAHARENLCCACVSCNLAKGAKLPFEFSGQAEMSF